jgi:hypothetical protein
MLVVTTTSAGGNRPARDDHRVLLGLVHASFRKPVI